MGQPLLEHLTPLQQVIMDIVNKYPGQFTRSGLAKMLVGAKSWQDTTFSEYGRFTKYTRKVLAYQIEILMQQGYLHNDKNDRLVAAG